MLKREIDRLGEAQRKQIANLINLLKIQARQATEAVPFWQRATPLERAQTFRAWVSQLPRTSPSLTAEACDRSTIYE